VELTHEFMEQNSFENLTVTHLVKKFSFSLQRWDYGFSNWSNPSSRTMALGSTQPVIEMSTRNIPGGTGRPARKADNFTAFCEQIVYKMLEPRPLTTLWASTACYSDSFTFTSNLCYGFTVCDTWLLGGVCIYLEHGDII
jgi:hypothetical protein